MRWWCVFPERCGTSCRMILGDRRPSVALITLHVHTHTYTNHRGYIVITLDQFPGVRSKQIIVHFSAQQEGNRELKQMEQSKSSNAKENNGKHQSGAEWKREEKKQGVVDAKDKRKHNVSATAEGLQMGEEMETNMALCLQKDRNKLSYPISNINRSPTVALIWNSMTFPWLSITGAEAHLCTYNF